MQRKTVAAHTLGCKVNQHETEAILELFRQAGYEVVDFNLPADVYLINTCTVTHLGDRKSRQAIRQARRRNPDALVVAAGCYAQRAPEEIARIGGADLIVGNPGKNRIVAMVEEAMAEEARRELAEAPLYPGGEECPEAEKQRRKSPGSEKRIPRLAVEDIMNARIFEELPLPLQQGRTRALVKIEDGCNQFCSYCIVPFVRGPVRSRQPEKILEEIALLVEHGYQEVVLTGIHTSAYGQDWERQRAREAGAGDSRRQEEAQPEFQKEFKEGTAGLGYLLERILKEIPQLKRLRLSSLEPVEVPPQVPELMRRYPAFCRHLHLPLQSGSDEILRLMRRPYSTREYAAIVENLRQQVPGLAITTDVMVGFPGETEERFEESFSFIRRMAFSNLHVFKYSSRPGTAAEKLPGQVPFAVKEERSRRLLRLAEELRRSFAQRFLGKELEVLLEEPLAVKRKIEREYGSRGFGAGELSGEYQHGISGFFGERFDEGALSVNAGQLAGEFWEGYSDNYLRIAVFVPCGREARGKLVRVRLATAGKDFSIGEIIGKWQEFKEAEAN